MPPSNARQNSVWRAMLSCSQVNTAAPATAPLSVWMPPISTITRPSTERGIDRLSGEMLPLENAYTAPARPANTPASAKPSHCCRRTSMPMASARSGESRPARSA